MDIRDYPRPANDTGIGVHWTVGYATAVGTGKLREFWLPELKAMGVKWVKIFNHDGALDFAELLLAEGIMPIVRIYRPSPNPGRLGVKELVYLDSLIRVGVRYFEFNNEPDVDAEWRGGRVPVNGLEITVENTIAALEIILERGGMPAIPALANGSRWDLVGKIVAAGRRDLFEGPVWQAMHNFSRNRPLDYPYDSGNQEGAAYTERFYQIIHDERWGADAWRGRSLAEVNRLRHDRRNPGATIADDHACWLAYEYFDALNRKHLGRSLPILSTECGYIVGEDSDPRYPATTPDLHLAQTLEACRAMMGTSQRFKPAPDYYFCTAFWLVANEQLGSSSSWWESSAWFSDRWPGGALPIVRALQAEPKRARIAPPAPPAITLRGVVAGTGDVGALPRAVVLEKDGVAVARTTLDEASQFELGGLVPGRYELVLEGTALRQVVELAPEPRDVVISLRLQEQIELTGRSVVAGTVRGGAGAVVVLVHKASGAEWVTMAHDDGGYRFVDLPAGVYSVRVDPEGTQVDDVALDGRGQAQVDLAQFGWGYTVTVAEDVQKIGAIVVSVPGRAGCQVRTHGSEGSREAVAIGTAPEYGPNAALLAPLAADSYFVTVEGVADAAGKPVPLEARVNVDKRSIPLVEFVHTPPVEQKAPQESAISGHVYGGRPAAHPVHVRLLGAPAGPQVRTLEADGSFAFTGLAAGLYAVALAGHEEAPSRSDIALDGRNQVVVDIVLPAEEAPPSAAVAAADTGDQGIIAGFIPEAVGDTARLVDAVGNERRQAVGADGRFRFEGLPAGVYAVYVEGGFSQAEIVVDGRNGWEILFSPIISVWEATVTNAGSMPGFSSIRVEVEGERNLPVRVWQGEEDGQTAATGSQPEQGPDRVEFTPLGPGVYIVEPEGIGVWASVELTGLEAVWVSFRRTTAPVSPNVVQPLRGGPFPAFQTSAPPAEIYLYVEQMPTDLYAQIALLRFVAAERPAVGNDAADAAHADRVILVAGNTSTVEAQLVELGARVVRYGSGMDVV